MQSCIDPAEAASQTRHRRRFSRYPLRSLSYVRLDQGNGGIIRDLTESGIAIQVVAALRENQQVRVSFDLLSPRLHVEALARVAWADPGGQGGLEFSALPQRTRRALRDWLFTQMLSSAAITGRDSMFHSLEPQLVTSAASRPAIIIPETSRKAESPRIHWGLVSISSRAFANLLDSVVLLCAVLLFSISSLAVMGSMPAWPLATAFFATSFIIFIAVYRLIFSELVCRATPGARLAALAVDSALEEQGYGPRFR